MASKKEKPALKKSDILASLKDKKGENRTDLTKTSLEAELAKQFEFIPEFFGYLFAMYAGAGKFEILDVPEDAEDGVEGLLLIKAMGQVRTTNRDMYTLSFAEETVAVEYEDGTEGTEDQIVISCEMSILKPGEKLPEGSSLSPASAAKIGKTQAYAVYKETLEALEIWVVEQKVADPEPEQAEAA